MYKSRVRSDSPKQLDRRCACAAYNADLVMKVTFGVPGSPECGSSDARGNIVLTEPLTRRPPFGQMRLCSFKAGDNLTTTQQILQHEFLHVLAPRPNRLAILHSNHLRSSSGCRVQIRNPRTAICAVLCLHKLMSIHVDHGLLRWRSLGTSQCSQGLQAHPNATRDSRHSEFAVVTTKS